MLFTRQLLLVLLPQVFCNAAAADDEASPMRKRTQQRHTSSGSSAHLRGGSTGDFDPFMGVPRELRADDRSSSMLMLTSMSMSMSMPQTQTSFATSMSMSMPQTQTSFATTPAPTPASTPAATDEEPQCEEDPALIPLEVEIITDDGAVRDKTGYLLISDPEDGSEPEIYLERASGSMSDSETYIDSICVPKGRYTFTVYDEWYGLSGTTNGVYSVKMRGNEILWGRNFAAPSASYTIVAGYEPEMTEEDEQWLVGHNQRRKQFHEDNDTTFKPLTWSESLKQVAADYAASITPACQVTGKTDDWGYNVAIAAKKVIDPAQILPDNVLRFMYNQKISTGKVYPDNKSMTQVAWRGSRYVGCASLIKEIEVVDINAEEPPRYCHVSVCKYGRPGNCSTNVDNWLAKTLADRSPCGRACPDEGCH